ncbi:serine O-acetyltransferase [Eisenbergiella sp.]|uniref:serine O-acetyltransferase n=1 Tax=Eisenbergiella sp. TaxID=1924109 RepID=UPI00208842A3|nr:hypothetical protein [Eisenbergiella sp.]GKH41926.1 serine acetyltransferase [Lachnospiraceae bacterium]
MRIIDDFIAFQGMCEGGGKIISTLFFNPNFHSVCLFRLSNLFYKMHLSVISKIIWYVNRLLFHVDIDYRANIAGGFVLIHGLGTVIGKSVISKGRLIVYQNVTLGGGNGKPGRLDADGKVRGMPLFESNCIVYAGAIVVGGIIVKANTVIKAGRIVADDT